jgi:hypothetical protein
MTFGPFVRRGPPVVWSAYPEIVGLADGLQVQLSGCMLVFNHVMRARAEVSCPFHPTGEAPEAPRGIVFSVPLAGLR